MPQNSGRFFTWASLMLIMLSFGILIMAGSYLIHQDRNVDENLCEQTVESRAALRRTWTAAEIYILRLARGDHEREQETRMFFRAVLTTIPPLECVDRRPIEVRR